MVAVRYIWVYQNGNDLISYPRCDWVEYMAVYDGIAIADIDWIVADWTADEDCDKEREKRIDKQTTKTWMMNNM